MTDSQFPRSIELPPASTNGPGFDDYRWSQLVEENKRITELLDGHHRVITALKDRIDDQTNCADRIHRRVVKLEARKEEQHYIIAALDERLRVLEDAQRPPVKDRDDLNERIVAFLESVPSLKFSAISIRENLGDGTKDVYDRCKTLARNGRIRMFTEPNRRALYQALPVADEVQS